MRRIATVENRTLEGDVATVEEGKEAEGGRMDGWTDGRISALPFVLGGSLCHLA